MRNAIISLFSLLVLFTGSTPIFGEAMVDSMPVGVQIKFSEWTKNNRTEQELKQLQEIILQPIKNTKDSFGDDRQLLITYEEDGWVSIGYASGVDWTLAYAIKDKQGKETLNKQYSGNVEAKVGKVVENTGDTALVSLGVAVNFSQVKDDVAGKLKEDPPLAMKKPLTN